MQSENVQFRFSDSDLAAYLVTQGYSLIDIEVISDKKHNGRPKAFIVFEGNKDDFLKIQDEYKENKIKISLKDFSLARQYVNRLVKEKL